MRNRTIMLFSCLMIIIGDILCWNIQEKKVLQTSGNMEREIDYIKWVEFNVTCEAMRKACQYDIDTYGKEVHLDWIELLAYLGAKYGGDFSRYQEIILKISQVL